MHFADPRVLSTLNTGGLYESGAAGCGHRSHLHRTHLRTRTRTRACARTHTQVDFTNPGVLGTASQFRKKYQSPILTGREPDATDGEREKGNQAQVSVSACVHLCVFESVCVESEAP